VSSSIAYVLYFNGISTGIELSKAGVISVLELIVSIILSVTLIGEKLSTVKFIGIITIVISIIIIQNSDILDRSKNVESRKAG
jgi:drug/metabolite transporter (DMT)-like permease